MDLHNKTGPLLLTAHLACMRFDSQVQQKANLTTTRPPKWINSCSNTRAGEADCRTSTSAEGISAQKSSWSPLSVENLNYTKDVQLSDMVWEGEQETVTAKKKFIMRPQLYQIWTEGCLLRFTSAQHSRDSETQPWLVLWWQQQETVLVNVSLLKSTTAALCSTKPSHYFIFIWLIIGPCS